ncbi:MAG: hypothetical protein MUC96_38100 [Myxococcaceae bacterium]|nr:hypothetical protein [Myxococcaceae bacterium]
MAGTEVVVISTCEVAMSTRTTNRAVARRPPLLATTVNARTPVPPTPVGVPVSSPDADSDNPSGSAPWAGARLHVVAALLSPTADNR